MDQTAPALRGSLGRSRQKVAYLYLLLVIFSALIFTIGPFIYAFYVSFTNYHLVMRLNDFDWVGPQNYRALFDRGSQTRPSAPRLP